MSCSTIAKSTPSRRRPTGAPQPDETTILTTEHPQPEQLTDSDEIELDDGLDALDLDDLDDENDEDEMPYLNTRHPHSERDLRQTMRTRAWQ